MGPTHGSSGGPYVKTMVAHMDTSKRGLPALWSFLLMFFMFYLIFYKLLEFITYGELVLLFKGIILKRFLIDFK